MSKQVEPGYPSYGGYLYSIPGYSAFQPISYPGIMQPTQAPIQNDLTNSDFVPFPPKPNDEIPEEKITEVKTTESQPAKIDLTKPQTDFEEQFTPEIVPAVSIPEVNKSQTSESTMSITSLTQGSGATVTIPSQIANKDVSKKKAPERFSLKTSIPISKIDLKCVNNTPETVVQSTPPKNAPVPFNPAFQTPKPDNAPRIEIQSNIIIKNATIEPEVKETKQLSPQINNITTLINAAEAINKSDNQFRKPDPKTDVINEIKDPPPNFPTPVTTSSRTMFNSVNLETSKANFSNSDQKNQILFINKNSTNPKMLLTIQQQNPQVLLQRTNFDSKNLQAPSRLSNQSKKSKDDLVENGTSSKVVALKRLHQENCDENDFENLITENQIYGNKIVVKEKSQGTLQEQDLKNKSKAMDKTPVETKNVVLQPNFLYLSNVQFPANLMMIKNNPKVNQPIESNKNKITTNENKGTNEVSTMTNSNDVNSTFRHTKPQNVAVSKELHVLKSSNSMLTSKNNKDVIFQTPQKVIMNSQIVYQVPMIVDSDNKLNQPFINREYPKLISQNTKEYTKSFEQSKSNDKLFIACPYQMDSKLQPKIVITNIRPKISKTDEVSCLDLYEKRKRMRRLKYLSNRETKDTQKVETKKSQDKANNNRNIVTPDKIKAEIYREIANMKLTKDDGSSESDSDYGDDDLELYSSIIKEFGISEENENGKEEFLSNFRLATRDVYEDKELDRQERILRRDSVASAYIAAGRIDRLSNEENIPEAKRVSPLVISTREDKHELQSESDFTLQRKQLFLSQLKLIQVTQQDKEGYERVWQAIIKDRKRRNGIIEPDRVQQSEKLNLDTSGQLQLLTEIKKYVNENNNLIKKRLDSADENLNSGDCIRILAEKNFSELTRLSNMADRSVKLITGQDARKRDLNPGFDSENIQRSTQTQPFQNYPSINIPNISKIISLKSIQEPAVMTSTQTMTTQATSMDEPQNSAAGVNEMFCETMHSEKIKDFGCQVEQTFAWPGLKAVLQSFKEFDAARKTEINSLHRRNTALRVAGAHTTRAASHHSDRARALLAERQHLATDENQVRMSLQRLTAAIDSVRNYTL